MTTDALVVGIDLGTTYFKVGLFDANGNLRGLGRAAVAPLEGIGQERCELAVTVFEELLKSAFWDACRAAGSDAPNVRLSGISYSSQANSFILLDDGNRPLTPLILWPDQRSKILGPALDVFTGHPDRGPVTGVGLAVNPQFAINKLVWFQEQAPDIWRAARRIMTISDYLVWRLTGCFMSDLGTAGLLGIVACREADWWPVALDGLNLERDRLTPLAFPGTLVGPTSPQAEALGFTAGVPVALGGLDHHMAAVGAGVPSRAQASVSLGTVLACVANSAEYRPQPDCYCGHGLSGQGYMRLTFTENGGGTLEWFLHQHAPGRTLAELDAAAAAVPSGCDGLRALPDVAKHKGLQCFINASPSHTEGHYFRALMESSARSLCELLKPLGMPSRLVLTGGGARSAVWRRIMHEITGCTLLAQSCPEPACRGAALVAAAAAGWFPSLSVAEQEWNENWVRNL